MTSHWHPRKLKTGILVKRRLEFWLSCFLFLRQERVRVNLFLQKKLYNKIVRSLDYLNRCEVLYVYVDITVLFWQKANRDNQHLHVKS